MNPYVNIPLVIFESRDNGVLTPDQFDVFTYCYWRAERPEYVVRGFSASNVCRFRCLDATKANLKRYQRAAADLLNFGLIRRDYHRVDTRRANQHARPYNVWVPNPDRFGVIGTPDENRVSLFVSSNVAVVVADNVALPTAANDSKENTSENTECDNVAMDVALMQRTLSFTNQENPKTIEKNPLNLPSGDFSPTPLPPGGERSDAAGLLKPHAGMKPSGKKNNPLNASQCERLNEAALLYADFSTWLYAFSPDVTHVQALLRDFTPTELLFAQITRFSLEETVPKNSMAQFFYKSARTAIEAAHLKGISKAHPESLKRRLDSWGLEYAKEFGSRWKIVFDAWIRVFGDDRPCIDEILVIVNETLGSLRADKLASEVITYAESLDSRVMGCLNVKLGRFTPNIKRAIQQAEAELGYVSKSVWTAIIKQQITDCKGDIDALQNFGYWLCNNLVRILRSKAGEPPTDSAQELGTTVSTTAAGEHS